MYTLIFKSKDLSNIPTDEYYDSYEQLCVRVFHLMRNYRYHNIAYYKYVYSPAGLSIYKKAICGLETSPSLMICAITNKNKHLNLDVLFSLGESAHLKKGKKYVYHLHAYRDGPVENIHKRKHCSYFRKIRTFQERALISARLAEEGEPEFRGNRKNLPNSWDGIGKSNYGNHCWKKQRKGRKSWDR